MRRRSIAVLATAAALVIVSWGGSAGALPTPSAVVSQGATDLGGFVRVVGAGWLGDVGNSIEVVLCGNNALDGTVNCNLTNTAEGGVRADGTFYAGLYLKAPPAPCPCVLRLYGLASGYEVDLPLVVGGVPTAPPESHVIVRRAVRISDAHFVQHNSWKVLFGAPPDQTLVYDVTNTGNVRLDRFDTDVVWGKGAIPTGFVVAPVIGELSVDQTRLFRVRIPVGALTIGSYRAVIRVDPVGPVATARVRATAPVPWGLMAVVFLGLVLIGRAVVKRRVAAVGARRAPIAVAVPGWYADPANPAQLRLWDGRRWAGQTRGLQAPTPTPVPAEVVRPGWYDDPTTPGRLRLWNGDDWTERTRDLVSTASSVE